MHLVQLNPTESLWWHLLWGKPLGFMVQTMCGRKQKESSRKINLEGKGLLEKSSKWKSPANALSWPLTLSSQTCSLLTSVTSIPGATSECRDCKTLFSKRTWRQLQTLKKKIKFKKQSNKLFSVTKHSLPSCLSVLQDGIHNTCQVTKQGAHRPQCRNALSTQLLGYFKVSLHKRKKKSQMPRNSIINSFKIMKYSVVQVSSLKKILSRSIDICWLLEHTSVTEYSGEIWHTSHELNYLLFASEFFNSNSYWGHGKAPTRLWS